MPFLLPTKGCQVLPPWSQVVTHDPISFISDLFILEVSWEAGVLPGKQIPFLGFDIVFIFNLILSVGQKLLQILGLDASSSLFPMFRLLQNSTGIRISYCSGYRGSNCSPQDIWMSGRPGSFHRNVWLFIRHEIVGYHISSSEQLSNPFHTYLEEEHIFRWLNAYAAAILKLYCLVFFPTLEIPIIISTTT